MKVVVTGATGKLGHLVVEGLLKKIEPSQVVAAVRSPSKAADLTALGVDVRHADSTRPDTLKAAFNGTQKVLLISTGDLAHHRAVIEAAKKARVRMLVYTSVLHAEKSKLAFAEEHRTTEKLVRSSGLTYAILRNGLYIENFTDNVSDALVNGAVIGSARDGRVAAASRADYAAAAVEVLTGLGHENQIYELAGDNPFSMQDLAAEVSTLVGRTIAYEDLSPADYGEMLSMAGVPVPLAKLLVESNLAIARGEMNDATGELRRLIGRPTTSLLSAVSTALASAVP